MLGRTGWPPGSSACPPPPLLCWFPCSSSCSTVASDEHARQIPAALLRCGVPGWDLPDQLSDAGVPLQRQGQNAAHLVSSAADGEEVQALVLGEVAPNLRSVLVRPSRCKLQPASARLPARCATACCARCCAVARCRHGAIARTVRPAKQAPCTTGPAAGCPGNRTWRGQHARCTAGSRWLPVLQASCERRTW